MSQQEVGKTNVNPYLAAGIIGAVLLGAVLLFAENVGGLKSEQRELLESADRIRAVDSLDQTEEVIHYIIEVRGEAY